MVEEEPGAALTESRVAPAVFQLETFDALVFELKDGFSLLAKTIGRRRYRLFLGSFITALSVCVSDRGPSTDTPRPFALLILWDSLRPAIDFTWIFSWRSRRRSL